MRGSVVRRIRLGLPVAVAAVLVLAGALLIYLAFRAERRQIAELQRERATRAAQRIGAYFDDLFGPLDLLERISGLADQPRGLQARLLDALTRRNSAYELLAILDDTGRVVASVAPYGGALPADFAESPAFLRPLRDGAELVGAVEVDPSTHLPTMIIAKPIRDRTDAIAGVLYARVNLKFLGFVVAPPGPIDAYVVDDRGRLVAAKRLPRGAVPPARPPAPPFGGHRGLGKASPAREYHGRRGVRVLGAAALVPRLHWRVVVEEPTAVAYAPIHRMIAAMSLAILAATLAAAALASRFARSVAQPLDRLTRAATVLRGGDLSARADVTARNELGLLAATFNEMAARLGARVADLREHAAQAERAAAERARLLEAEQAARADAEAAERRASLLARASAALSESLDAEASLNALARLCVPATADWCAAMVRLDDGRFQHTVVHHVDPELLSRLRRSDLASVAEGVCRDRAPLVIGDVAAAQREGKLDARSLRALAEVPTRSAMAAPMVVRGRVLGAVVLGSVTAGRFCAEDGQLAGALARRAALAVDNARLYRQTQEAVRARDLFMSIASHELKTPLTPLMLAAQTLERALAGAADGVPAEKLRAPAEMVGAQAARLAGLVDELLDVARLASGRLRLQPEPGDLAQLVRDAVARFREHAGVEIHVDAAGPIPGQWDRMRLEQILGNLLSNAVKYGAGKPVDVEVAAEGEKVRLAVRDRGIGIAPQDLPRIFQQFERAVSERAYGGGLGLGLFITRQIVEAHGGTIEVESRVGEGSTFTVRLPRG